MCACGCASNRVAQIDAAAFRNYGASPLQHTMYMGSDAEFHYFAWSDSLRSGRWRVRKVAMPFRTEWAVELQRGSFLVQDQDGQWQPSRPPPLSE
jgi:hypothetical protein